MQPTVTSLLKIQNDPKILGPKLNFCFCKYYIVDIALINFIILLKNKLISMSKFLKL